MEANDETVGLTQLGSGTIALAAPNSCANRIETFEGQPESVKKLRDTGEIGQLGAMGDREHKWKHNVLVGLNHIKDGEDYKVPGHFIEPIYVCPVDADWADYHSQRCSLIENLRYAGHKVIIKVKYRQNCDMPRTERELKQYLDVLGSDVLPRLHGGMGISFGNEPNWLPDPSDISTGNKPAWAAKVCAMSFALLEQCPARAWPVGSLDYSDCPVEPNAGNSTWRDCRPHRVVPVGTLRFGVLPEA